jgi:dienelactone hydrolase
MVKRGKKSLRKWLMVIGGLLFGLCATCCGGIGWLYWTITSPTSFPKAVETYADARKGFQTRLLRQSPAPQSFTSDQVPPGVDEISYLSTGLTLKAWVTAPSEDATRQPAVLFLHGGFAFGAEDWKQTALFRDAGFVVMVPMVRGENGLPGSYSMFYNEVDDVLAAATVLAELPNVNKDRLYVCGHSVGGTLALLACMSSDRFRAAASLSGSPDQVAWSRFQMGLVPFDPNDPREYQMRSPLAFPGSFQCPVRMYYGSEEFLFAASSQKTAKLAKANQLDVEAISIPGGHFSSVPAAIAQSITFFRQH